MKNPKLKNPLNLNVLWMDQVKKQVKNVTSVMFIQDKSTHLVRVRINNSLKTEVVSFKLEATPEKMTSREWEYIIHVLNDKQNGLQESIS